MSKKVIAQESFEAVMDELSKEVKEILDAPTDNNEEKVAFTLFFNTLKATAEKVFEYLPEGERKDVVDICASWMCVGLLLGRAPKRLADILKKTGAKIIVEEKGGDTQ